MMSRPKVSALLAVLSVSVLTSASHGAEANSCWACDTDWFGSGGCWLYDFHQHETLGVWNFDGHTYSHGWMCGYCGDHGSASNCDGSAGLAGELEVAVQENKDVRDILVRNAHLVRVNSQATKVIVLDCGSGEPYREIALTPSQSALLRLTSAAPAT